MSRRRELDQHRQGLAEIREIMNSMKTLAYMETRKLAKFIDAQRAVVESIEVAASDLLAFHPDILPPSPKESRSAYLLIGSERGFCGDFNRALLEKLQATLESRGEERPLLIAFGRKLLSLLEDDPRLAVSLEGASTVDEVAGLLAEMVSELIALETQYPGLKLHAVFHNSAGDIEVKSIMPPFTMTPEAPPMNVCEPAVNLSPSALFYELSDHYLFAVLHQVLYTSLHAENRNRVTHMDGAVRHLDEEFEQLTQRFNALRQEEITEEIEVILLNAANLEQGEPFKKNLGR